MIFRFLDLGPCQNNVKLVDSGFCAEPFCGGRRCYETEYERQCQQGSSSSHSLILHDPKKPRGKSEYVVTNMVTANPKITITLVCIIVMNILYGCHDHHHHDRHRHRHHFHHHHHPPAPPPPPPAPYRHRHHLHHPQNIFNTSTGPTFQECASPRGWIVGDGPRHRTNDGLRV